jgi:hypothetical protein
VTTEHQDVLKTLETMIEKLEHLSVQQKAVEPRRQEAVDDLLTETHSAIDAIVRWQRKLEDQEQLVGVLKAIRNNTNAIQQLSVSSEARLRQIEDELTEPDSNLPTVDPNLLAEAAFLKSQLAGVAGTEGPGPLFKDAPAVEIPFGLDVLAAAVNNADSYSMSSTS